MINDRIQTGKDLEQDLVYTEHWIARASSTPIIYFASGINALNRYLQGTADQTETPIGAGS